MPTYQYRCTACGSDLEAVQKFSDAALTACPTCGGSLRKVFNAVGVVFKGSGFYRNDSRAGSGAKGNGNGSSETSGDGAKTEKSATSVEAKGGELGSAAGAKGSGGKTPADSSGAKAKQPAGSASGTGSSTAS